jgi:L-rhamnose mutarotase|tara:strand:+ start:5087 stop:5407 length:321 start_codon:yes stop_codon:yes gene_type:complete
MGMVIGIYPEKITEYKQLHAQVWPAVTARLKRSNISNYTIFLHQPENLLFAYWEYNGKDFEKDRAKTAKDPDTQEWWKLCDPLQDPLASRKDGEWWSRMGEIFHLD